MYLCFVFVPFVLLAGIFGSLWILRKSNILFSLLWLVVLLILNNAVFARAGA